MRFDKIFILGSGKIAISCLKNFDELELLDKLEVIETECVSISLLKRVCERRYVKYVSLTHKDDITKEIMENVFVKGVLIISANNKYIFPREIVDNEKIKIINFHYALLPDYRGSNIPSWVIWNNEKYTGVTWHYVDKKIDHGGIIAQEKIYLDKKTTAYDIVKQGMYIGEKLFKEFIGDLLEREMESKEAITNPIHFYKTKNIPNNGLLCLDMECNDIERLLRAYDYGPISILSPLIVELEHNKYYVDSYAVCEKDELMSDDVRFDGKELKIVRQKKEISVRLRKKDEIVRYK